MPIIYKSNMSRVKSRKLIKNIINEKKRNGIFEVIDVGGIHNPWAKEITDYYIDIQSDTQFEDHLFVGDINEIEIWDRIITQRKGKKFDFSICTQTLEDLRDPIFVIKQLKRISSMGYISTPNKHIEFSNPTSSMWLGYAHHRWIFSVKEKGANSFLFIIPKWPCVEYFNSKKKSFSFMLGQYRGIGRIAPLFGLKWKNKQIIGIFDTSKRRFGNPKIHWLIKDIASEKNELGFIWEHDFNVEFEDFSKSTDWQIKAYNELLKEGL